LSLQLPRKTGFAEVSVQANRQRGAVGRYAFSAGQFLLFGLAPPFSIRGFVCRFDSDWQALRSSSHREDRMPTFICSLSWTEQGIRAVKDAPKRAQAARDLAKKVGVEIKEVFMTSGDDDLVVVIDTPNGDNVAKFALALSAQGSVRTRTVRAWRESEYHKLISELP
jgi:uncharacterized protein with GYD domain